MNLNSSDNSPNKTAILWLVPIITFVVMGITLINARHVFMYGGDPMYAYLLNGLTLARGEADIGHTDNPGTTVQVFSAIIIRVIYFFSSSDNITDDVIGHPEKYLFIARLIQISLISLSLFWLGKKVYKWQNNSLPVALFLQNSALTGVMTITHSHSFAPEGLLIIGGIAMLALCMKILSDQQLQATLPKRYAILFGIICGFMIITKLPGAVYVFIPLFVLTGLRSKLIFAASFVGSAFLFVLPAINRIHFLFDFAVNVATHSGHYGAGEAEMLNTSEFIDNLKMHFSGDIVLTLVLLAAIITLGIGLIQYKTWFRSNSIWFRMLFGITITILANLFLATKHFGYHYLIPSQVLLALVVYILIRLYSTKITIPSLSTLHIRALIVVACVAVPAALCARYNSNSYFFDGFRQLSITGNKILFKVKKLPRIYVTEISGGAGPEPAFNFGYAYSGDSRFYYGEFIAKHYPGAFIYEASTGAYHNYGNAVTEEVIATTYPELWFYVYRDTALGGKQQRRFLALRDSLGPVVTFQHYYSEPTGLEHIYYMECDTARARKIFPVTREFVFDFEKVSTDTTFLSTDASVEMETTLKSATSKAFSGKHALYFEKENVFSGKFTLPVVAGAMYEITAWKYGDALSWIVATSGPNNEFYQAGAASTGRVNNGWKEIMLRVVVPNDFQFPNLNVYIYNGDRHGQEMWIDDLRVKEYQRKFAQ